MEPDACSAAYTSRPDGWRTDGVALRRSVLACMEQGHLQPPFVSDVMGDDGTGHCRGCGNPLDRINASCAVCVGALHAFMDEEVDSNGEPF